MDKSVLEVEDILKMGFDKVAEYGNKYKRINLDEEIKRKGWTNRSLLNDWWIAFRFFCGRCFAQGRRDELSSKFESSTFAILKRFFGNINAEIEDRINSLKKQGFLDMASFDKYVKTHKKKKKAHKIYQEEVARGNPIIKELEKGRSGTENSTGRERDRLMVLNLLSFATEIPERNIVKYCKRMIEEGDIEKAYNQLNSIVSIGPKISSFLLRDITLLYDLEAKISIDDQIYGQPIDTWIAKIAFSMMNKEIRDKNLPAARFNAGAWFYLWSKSREKDTEL
ncbi:MAG: hypothetical protein WED04_07390 [Promethearchaeati archaeon SRVP18_Atabeyarchaeia-1]